MRAQDSEVFSKKPYEIATSNPTNRKNVSFSRTLTLQPLLLLGQLDFQYYLSVLCWSTTYCIIFWCWRTSLRLITYLFLPVDGNPVSISKSLILCLFVKKMPKITKSKNFQYFIANVTYAHFESSHTSESIIVKL